MKAPNRSSRVECGDLSPLSLLCRLVGEPRLFRSHLSQRDNATQPRVARNELPWFPRPRIPSTLKGLRLSITSFVAFKKCLGIDLEERVGGSRSDTRFRVGERLLQRGNGVFSITSQRSEAVHNFEVPWVVIHGLEKRRHSWRSKNRQSKRCLCATCNSFVRQIQCVIELAFPSWLSVSGPFQQIGKRFHSDRVDGDCSLVALRAITMPILVSFHPLTQLPPPILRLPLRLDLHSQHTHQNPNRDQQQVTSSLSHGTSMMPRPTPNTSCAAVHRSLSQRDNATQPRVARNEPPWVARPEIPSTLKGLRPRTELANTPMPLVDANGPTRASFKRTNPVSFTRVGITRAWKRQQGGETRFRMDNRKWGCRMDNRTCACFMGDRKSGCHRVCARPPIASRAGQNHLAGHRTENSQRGDRSRSNAGGCPWVVHQPDQLWDRCRRPRPKGGQRNSRPKRSVGLGGDELPRRDNASDDSGSAQTSLPGWGLGSDPFHEIRNRVCSDEEHGPIRLVSSPESIVAVAREVSDHIAIHPPTQSPAPILRLSLRLDDHSQHTSRDHNRADQVNPSLPRHALTMPLCPRTASHDASSHFFAITPRLTQPSLRDLFANCRHPGVKTPGYYHPVPLGQNMRNAANTKSGKLRLLIVFQRIRTDLLERGSCRRPQIPVRVVEQSNQFGYCRTGISAHACDLHTNNRAHPVMAVGQSADEGRNSRFSQARQGNERNRAPVAVGIIHHHSQIRDRCAGVCAKHANSREGAPPKDQPLVAEVPGRRSMPDHPIDGCMQILFPGSLLVPYPAQQIGKAVSSDELNRLRSLLACLHLRAAGALLKLFHPLTQLLPPILRLPLRPEDHSQHTSRDHNRADQVNPSLPRHALTMLLCPRTASHETSFHFFAINQRETRISRISTK